MTLTIELTPEQAARLRAAAAATGTDEAGAIRQLIESLPPAETWGARSLRQLQAEGVIGSWADVDDVENYSRNLREKSQRRGNAA